MSISSKSPVPFRLQRSELAVPGSNPKMIQKAVGSEADCVFLDCEDAVAPAHKNQARFNIIRALNENDWKAEGKSVSVRINGLDSPCMYRDIVEIVEQAGHRIDTVLIPKVSGPEDVYVVETILSQIESACALSRRIGVECLIETASGMANVEAIAQSSGRTGSRLEALHFGVADFSASCQSRTQTIGGVVSDQADDVWHPSLQRMLVACRAFGLRAIDGPYGDFNDNQGFITAARRVAAMGYDGKWAIHPSQVELANQVMTPTDAEIVQAKEILDALDRAEQSGQGAASLDGKMIDLASKKMAESILEKSFAISQKTQFQPQKQA